LQHKKSPVQRAGAPGKGAEFLHPHAPLPNPWADGASESARGFMPAVPPALRFPAKAGYGPRQSDRAAGGQAGYGDK
jgi:hypothetical protein